MHEATHTATKAALHSQGQRLRLRVALTCSAAVFAAGVLAAALLMWSFLLHAEEQTRAGRHAITNSVAETLANQTARALRLGIPLEAIPGVTDYLKLTLENSPDVAYLAVTHPDGTPLHSISLEASEQLVNIPVVVKGKVEAHIHAGAKAIHGQSLGQPALLSAIAVLLAAVLAGVVGYWGPGRRLQKRHALLVEGLQAHQIIPQRDRQAADALEVALNTLADLQWRNQEAKAAVNDYSAELLAVDFDEQMRPSIEKIVQPARPTPEST